LGIIGGIWTAVAMQPMINTLIVMSSWLFGSFGLAIIGLTIVVRGLMFPLTIKQLRATKAMQALQPKLAELKQKYGKDKEKFTKEQVRLYKESGVSPAGCLLPMLVQLPVWIALFWSIMRVLAVTPEQFLGLSQYLYSWPVVYSMLPLSNEFIGLNLAEGNILLAIVVGCTMWAQQKMVAAPAADPKQKAQSQMMLWTMPLMFGFLSLTLPSGLALYWTVSNGITIIIQYFVTGWGGLAGLVAWRPSIKNKLATRKPPVTDKLVARKPSIIDKLMAWRPSIRDREYKERISQVEEGSSVAADTTEVSSAQEEQSGFEEPGDKQQDSGGGHLARLKTIRHQPRKGKGHRGKRG
jgi:YidC/Oxa1 family membrane protein insertase